MKKNVILADTIVDEKWEFYSGVQNESGVDWDIKCWNNAGLKNNSLFNIKRIFGYFFHAFSIFRKRKKIENIIAWQQFYGLNFAFYSMLFHVKKVNKLTIMTFIYKPKKGLLGGFYAYFIRKILNSGYIDHIIVFSKGEVEYYSKIFGTSMTLFKYMPLGIESKKQLKKTTVSLPEKFLLSVGRSNRDYDFLIRCSKKLESFNIVIITDIIHDTTAFPPNVMLLNGIRGEEYFKILDKCEAVLIPLKEQNMSSGQLVLLQSMQYKKPIVITETNSIAEYVTNNINALIVPKDEEVFCQAVETVTNNKEIALNLVNNGYEKYKNEFSLEALGRRIGELYEERDIKI